MIKILDDVGVSFLSIGILSLVFFTIGELFGVDIFILIFGSLIAVSMPISLLCCVLSVYLELRS